MVRLPAKPIPFITNAGSVAIPAKSTHPYSALLYLDFELSMEGSKSYDQFGYGVPRSDFNGKYTLPADKKRFYPSQVPNYEEAFKQWHQLLLDITTN